MRTCSSYVLSSKVRLCKSSSPKGTFPSTIFGPTTVDGTLALIEGPRISIIFSFPILSSRFTTSSYETNLRVFLCRSSLVFAPAPFLQPPSESSDCVLGKSETVTPPAATERSTPPSSSSLRFLFSSSCFFRSMPRTSASICLFTLS